MMDKVTQESKVNVKDLLLQRDEDRKTKLKNLKEQKELASPDQVKLFHESFEEHSAHIADNIRAIEEGKIDPKDLPEHFSKISKDLQVLNRFLSVSTVFLKNYNVRKSLQTIEEIETKVKDLEAKLLPKKKFGFKARKTKAIEKTNKQSDETDASVEKIILLAPISCGFSDRKEEKLRLDSEEIAKKDVELRNLEDCTVFLCGNPITVHMSKLARCKIASGPVSTSVFMEDCASCEVAVACQQLRVHSTTDSSFYTHVTSRAIIEDSTRLRFAPYPLQLEQHFISSELDSNLNHWLNVDDFNWLVADVPSPNWTEISEEERIQNWLL